MPNVLIVNDNASFASSDTFSTQDSIEQPRHALRRRNTVSQLTRRVSKRISHTILRAGVQEHQLSEKNLKSLNDTTNIDSHNLRSPAHPVHEVKIHDPIHEEIEEECPAFDVKAAREMRLQQSYAAFCQNFTLSGTTTTSTKFDLSMGVECADKHTQSSHTDQTLKDNDTSELLGFHANPEHIAVQRPRPGTVAFPISCPPTDLDNTSILHSTTVEKFSSEFPVTETSKVEKAIKITPDSDYLQPPPHIITPTVWMDMQRDERERKASRRQRLLNPFRSWFMTSQPSWGRRYEVVE
ncbi:hypothetical protein N7517_001857 [Penicillium concentricum]|uniref:Uncharacterized protein n=1 Tax=Penicillium concentricum TaxID=293559 RepID=A0A9W9ST17_9EURO|nr:uncharacterized protein N7517_001857 [Penicillium concentricum]KAJ5383946.1 hypothetical protein N7517_001857 [Penicillium concentricum]